MSSLLDYSERAVAAGRPLATARTRPVPALRPRRGRDAARRASAGRSSIPATSGGCTGCPGITTSHGQPVPRRRLRFDRITQPWLRQLANGGSRLRLTSGLSVATASASLDALTRFSEFLTDGRRRPVGRCRPAAAGALPGLAVTDLPGGHGVKKTCVSGIGLFFQAIRAARLGRQPAGHGGVLRRGPARPAPSRSPASWPSTSWPRSRHRPTSTDGQPRGPAGHPDPRSAAGCGPPTPARWPSTACSTTARARPTCATSTTRCDARPPSRSTRNSRPRSAPSSSRVLRAGRTAAPVPVPPAQRNPAGSGPLGDSTYRRCSAALAAVLRRPRRARQAGAPDPPPMAAHLRLPADQP